MNSPAGAIAPISLGSNIGERENHLQAAIQAITATPGIRIIQSSPVYDNPPLLYLDQARFLNQIVQIDCSLEPEELLISLQRIEKQVGRTETFRYGPRIIDLDILSYGDLVIDNPELTLPHPGISDREYLRHLLNAMGIDPNTLIAASPLR